MPAIPVALQLYTVRDLTAVDFPGTVRQVAEIGYAGVEFAGMGGMEAAALRDLLDETGLAPAGAHIALATLESDLDRVIADNLTLGNRYIGVPHLSDGLKNPQGFRHVAARMNAIGSFLADAGLTLYYHNHAFEFDVVDGERGIDILYQETDPELVVMEIDVYWVHYAGEDPAAMIRAHAGRFPLIHLKDMVGAGAERTYAEVGEGVIDFAPIRAASEAQGAEWYIVEQDACARPSLESVRISLDNIRSWSST